MAKEYAIEVKSISKKFKIYMDRSNTLRGNFLTKHRSRYEDRRVLEDISFSVKRGEAVGIIGENGCGKSTMLKLLTGIMYPDKGEVIMDGRVSALIELGAGFHPDMTGRENIYTNAAIFGLTRKEIDARLNDIIAFSELGAYIDNPVRTYSSGMYMRLAFSVAINVDADILLVDEILAVGDAAFQAKCFNRMREIKAAGTTIVIVSHSLGQVEQFCERSIWINNGKIAMVGQPHDVHVAYLDYMREKYEATEEKDSSLPEETDGQNADDETAIPQIENAAEVTQQEDELESVAKKTRWGNGDARVRYVKLLDAVGRERKHFATGEKMQIVIGYDVLHPLEKPACGIGIFRNDGLQCYGTNTRIDHIPTFNLGYGGEVICEIEGNYLMPGEYTLDVAIHTEDDFAYDYFRSAKSFSMSTDTEDVGVFRMAHKWTVKAEEKEAQ